MAAVFVESTNKMGRWFATRSWNAFGSMLSDFDCGILGDIRRGQSYRLPCRQYTSFEIRRQSDEERSAADCDGYSSLLFFHISFSPQKTSFQLFRPALGPYEKQSIDAPKKESTCCCALLITISILAARSCRCACDALKQAFWGSSLNAAEQETSGLTFFKTFLLAVKLNLFHWLATQTSHAALGWVLQRLNNRICNTLFW